MVKVNWLEAVRLRLFWNYCFKTGRKGRVRRQRLAPRQAAAMEPRLLLSATAIDDHLNVQYDPATTSLELDVLANDAGLTGETLQLVDAGVGVNLLNGAWGELEVRDNGVDPIVILYTPTVGHEETFSFQYQLSDGTYTSTATVQLNVQGELAPLTVGDAATVVAGGTVSIDPLTNDSDPEGTALTLVSVTNGSSGTASLSRYVPPALASEYQGYSYDYPTIDDYVTMYYGSWNDYFQFYGNPADDRMIVEYVSTDINFSGTDTLTYTVQDAAGWQSTGTITITVQANQAPVAADDSVIVVAGEVVTLDPLANDSDPEGTPLQLISVTQGTHGTVTLTRHIPSYLQSDYDMNGYGYSSIDDFVSSWYGSWNDYFLYYGNSADDRMVVEYTSTDVNYSGTDTFSYVVQDAAGLQSTGTVTVTVQGNQAPIANADTVTVNAGEAVSFDPLTNDSDPEGTALTVVSVSAASQGTATLTRYLPPGLMSEYQSYGGGYNSLEEYVQYNYGGWESYFLYYGNPADDRFVIQYASTNPAFTGEDTFTYVVEDAAGLQSTGTVTVTVQGNQAPIAQADTVTVNAGEAVSFDPIVNDSDPEGTPLRLISATGASHGTVELTRVVPASLQSEFAYEAQFGYYTHIDDYVNSYYGGWDSYYQYYFYGDPADINRFELRYTSTDASFSGDETLTYVVEDAVGLQSTGTITVTVLANQAPVTTSDSINVVAGGTVTIDPLTNDSDPEGTPLQLISVAGALEGTATVTRYIPPALASEYQGYMYDYPTIDDYVSSYYGGWEAYFQYYANPADNRMLVEYVSTNPGFTGTETLTYTVQDAAGLQSTGTITITVAGNQAPTTTADSYTVLPGESVTLNLLANDSDPEGTALSLISIATPTGGTVNQEPDVSQAIWDDWIYNGQYYGYSSFEDYYNSYYNYDGNQPLQYHYVYTPTAGFSGTDTFTYVVADAAGLQSTGTVTVTVAANQAPIAVDDSYSVSPGESVTLNLLANDSDPEGHALSISSIDTPANGTLTLEPDVSQAIWDDWIYNGQYYGYSSFEDWYNSYYNMEGTQPLQYRHVYTPNAGFGGTETFNYTLADSQGATATGTITVQVAANQSPIAGDDTATVIAGGTITIDPLTNDSDPEGHTLTLVSVTGAVAGTATLSRYVPPALASEYQGYTYDYATIDDYVMAYYGSWTSYFQNYGNPADDRMEIKYVSTDAGFSGTETLTYTVQDSQGASATGTITITVEPNLAPVAVTDELIVNANESATFDPLANDSDPEGTPLELISISAATAGTVTLTRYIPSYLQSDYDMNGSGYASIDDFVNSWYGGWDYYFQYNGNPADDRMVVEYVRNDLTTAGTDTFTYIVADADGNQSTGTVNVILLGDTPPAFDQAGYSFTLAENSAVDLLLGSVSATDPDTAQTLTYTITDGNAAGAFSIDSSTGEIRIADSAPLDFEVTPSFDLTVTATNTYGVSASTTVAITLTDENDPLQVADVTWNLSEAAQPGDVVGLVGVAQPNAGVTYSYAITAGNDEGLFAIDASTGEVTVSPSGTFDYETITGYNLTITTTSSDNETTTSTAGINITDVNEAAEPVIPAISPVSRSLEAGSTIAIISATDPEGDSFSFQISSQSAAGAFEIDPSTGEVYLADQSQLVSYEDETFQITVVLVDSATGVTSDPQTIEFEIEPNVPDPADTGIQLESGYWVDTLSTFVLPPEAITAQTTSFTLSTPIEETSEYNDSETGSLITYATTGDHVWTLDTVTTITTDGWTYEETYLSTVTTTTTDSDANTSSAVSAFSYSLFAYWGAEYAGYTLTVSTENEISGLITETWEETGSESLMSGGTLLMTWSSKWSDAISIDSKTTLANETMTVTTDNKFSSEYTADVGPGAGNYYYEVQGGKITGIIASSDTVSTTGTTTVTESKNAAGDWTWDSGISVVSGSTSSMSSYQSLNGDYSFTEDGNTTTGKISEQGLTSHSSSFEVTSNLQTDGSWLDVLGEMSATGSISSSYSYSASGSYVVDEPASDTDPAYDESGSFEEVGSTSSLLTYTGSAIISAGKWEGTASASGTNSTSLSSKLEGTYGTTSDGNTYAGTTQSVSTYSENLVFNQTAILDDDTADQSAWKWNNGTAKLEVIDSITVDTTGSTSYSYSLGESGGSGSGSGGGSDPDDTTFTPTRTGTVSGSISDTSTSTESSKVVLHQQLDTNSEWQVSSGTKSLSSTTTDTSSFTGQGGYIATVEKNGQLSGNTFESGSATTTQSEDADTTWDTNTDSWGDTHTSKSISGSSSTSYSSSGSGTYTQVSDEGTITVKTSESSTYYDSYTFDMHRSSVTAANSGSGTESSSTGDDTSEGQWDSGHTEASVSSTESFTYTSYGYLDFGGQDGGISGKIDTDASSNTNNSSFIRTEIQSDGSWAEVDGFKQTTTTNTTSSDFSGTGSFGDQGDIAIGVSITTRSSENTYENEKQEIKAPNTWKITEGKKDTRTDSSNSSSYSGGGSIDSGDLVITTTIDGKNKSSNDERKVEIYNTDLEQWRYETGQSYKRIDNSSENNVTYSGGGSLSGGQLPITVTVDGSNNTASSYTENHDVDADGTWTLDSGSDFTSSSNSMNMTYSGASTETIDDGDLFMNLTTSVSGGNQTSSSTSETRIVSNGSWGGSNGTETNFTSNHSDVTVHGMGTLNVDANGTKLVGQVTIDSKNNQSFTQDESYTVSDGMRSPVSGMKTSSNSQSNGDTFFATGSVDQGDLTLIITIDQSNETKSGSSESHTLVGDNNWAQSGGTFSSYSKMQDHFSYNGSGATTTSLNSGDLTGSITNNIKVSGFDKTDSTTNINGSIAADGNSTITNGSKIDSVHTNSTTSSSAFGSFTQPIEGGSISGSINQSSSTYSDNNQSTTATATGNSWSTIGTKTIAANGNSSYSSSATGSFSISSSTGTGIVTTNTKAGDVNQSSKGNSSYNHNETWTLVANSWGIVSGSKSNSSSSKEESVKNSTLGNTVIGSTTTTENGVTTTTSVTTAGGGHEFLETKSSSHDSSLYSLDSQGNWNLTAANNGSSSLVTYDTASSTNGVNTTSTSSTTSSKSLSVESSSSQKFYRQTDSWNSASFNSGDWNFDGSKTVTETTSSSSSYKQNTTIPDSYTNSEIQNGQITKNEGADNSSTTLHEVYSYVSGTSGSGMGDSGSLQLTSGKKTETSSNSSYISWSGEGETSSDSKPYTSPVNGGTKTGSKNYTISHVSTGFNDSSGNAYSEYNYNKNTQVWELDDSSFAKTSSSSRDFNSQKIEQGQDVWTISSYNLSASYSGTFDQSADKEIVKSNHSHQKANNGSLVQDSGYKYVDEKTNNSYSSSSSTSYTRGNNDVISGIQTISISNSGSSYQQEMTDWKPSANAWVYTEAGYSESFSSQTIAYNGSGTGRSASHGGTWEVIQDDSSKLHKEFNESIITESTTENKSTTVTQNIQNAYGTEADGSTWYSKTYNDSASTTDSWTRDYVIDSTFKREEKHFAYDDGTSSGNPPGQITTYELTTTGRTHYQDKYTYNVSTSSSGVTHKSFDSSISPQEVVTTTPGTNSGSASATYVDVDSSSGEERVSYGGQLAKGQDYSYVEKHTTTTQDQYDSTHAWGSSSVLYEGSGYDKTLQNGFWVVQSNSGSGVSPENYDIPVTGESEGFAGDAYYREYEQHRPGNNVVIPATPPPHNPAPDDNGPSPYSNSFYEFIGEYFVRPGMGDEFLTHGSDLAVYGTATGVIAGSVLLAYFGGGAVFSSGTLLGAVGNGALWGGLEYLAIGGIMEIGSGGLVPDMTLEGLATSVAFGGIIGGFGNYLLNPIKNVYDEIAEFTVGALKKTTPSSIKVPTHTLLEKAKLWLKHMNTVRSLKNGDIKLSSLGEFEDQQSIYNYMGELTTASGNEIVLLNTGKEYILRMGTPTKADFKGGILIAHTHPNGILGLSDTDLVSIFYANKYPSTTIVGPKGHWAQFDKMGNIIGQGAP